MAKLAAPKKPTAKAAPKKPTSRSKTGNSACSEAASNWQLSLRGKAALNPETYQTLAKCRALSSTKKKADAYGRTGKLSDMGAAALASRADKRFDQGLVTQKSRTDRLNMLLKQRSERGKLSGPKLAPGRGTEERKQLASEIRTLRNVERGTAPVESAKSSKAFNDAYSELEYKMRRYAPSQRVEVAKQWQKSESNTKSFQSLYRDKTTINEQVYKSGKLTGATPEQVKSLVNLQRQRNEIEIAKTRVTALSARVAGKVYGAEASALVQRIEANKAAPKAEAKLPEKPWQATRDQYNANAANYDYVPKKPERSNRAELESELASISEQRKAFKPYLDSVIDKKRGDYKKNVVRDLHKERDLGELNARENAIKSDLAQLKKHEDRLNELMQTGHRRWVAHAVREGKQVPANVLADYPDLKPPTPARYSLGGKLAPGRGTEERKKVAGIVRSLRTGDAQTAAGTLKAAGLVAIPSKYDARRVAIKERDLWNAYTPREAAYRVLATRTLAGSQRKKKHMLRLGWVTP